MRGLKSDFEEYEPWKRDVAPFMGAWIEIMISVVDDNKAMSHPLWVRGLKYLSGTRNTSAELSHPLWVRGLKCDSVEEKEKLRASHPLWVRGLKSFYRKSYDMPVSRTLYGCVD